MAASTDRTVLIAVDASENARNAFDCEYSLNGYVLVMSVEYTGLSDYGIYIYYMQHQTNYESNTKLNILTLSNTNYDSPGMIDPNSSRSARGKSK